jgi:hypothetical protein
VVGLINILLLLVVQRYIAVRGVTGPASAADGSGSGLGGLKTAASGNECEELLKGCHMIVTGVVLLLLGMFLDIGILYTIGAILVVVGAVFWILGAFGRAVGPRAHYW